MCAKNWTHPWNFRGAYLREYKRAFIYTSGLETPHLTNAEAINKFDKYICTFLKLI